MNQMPQPHIGLRHRIRALVNSLRLPTNEILFVHARLKGLLPENSSTDADYARLSKLLIEEMDAICAPRTILVPTFTYDFTKSGIYDRVNTPCEVGRFGEEIRKIFSRRLRTMNPVFNVVDTRGYFTLTHINESTAFGEDSLMEILADKNYVIVNINLPKLISTHLHYVEYIHGVDYRYDKIFEGRVSEDGRTFEEVQYIYYVRDLELDTKWRRQKIRDFLADGGALMGSHFENSYSNWIYSDALEAEIGKKLCEEPRFLITD